MGVCPVGKSIDRKDVDKDYYKYNCRWATSKEQSNNMRNNRMVKIGNLNLNVTQWAEKLKVDRQKIFNRLRYYSPKEAVYGISIVS